MHILLRIVLAAVAVVAVVVVIAYADGATLPVNHSVRVSGTVNAPPEAVFARILDIANGAAWRPWVKSVEVLPQDNGRDAWIEVIGRGERMKFLALATTPVDAAGRATRVVETKQPSYGGTWTYALTPGPTPGTTTLTITEDGYLNPPIYRFIMAHIMGPTKNLSEYLSNMQAAANK